VKVVVPWLQELVAVPGDPERLAHEISLRGFEVASVDAGPMPVIDFEITANRPDCLSHIGLAREASTIWGLPLRLPDLTMPGQPESGDRALPASADALLPASADALLPASADALLNVRIDDPLLCPRYCAQIFEITVGPSPAWLADRLSAAGVRPISNIVDVTNYVMLELGQPMHAFDLERLAGRTLVVRRARAGEHLRTLDGVDRALEPDMLVIADGERASAIGGVMGGHDSEIGPSTRYIALESAYFHPASIRRTSKRLGLKTEAAIRFERGGDIGAPPQGIARAAALFQAIGAGRPIGPLIDRYPAPRSPGQVRLRSTRISRLLGQAVPAGDVVRILDALGFDVAPEDNLSEPSWQVTVPTFRVDVAREADLIEEVGRHYGFDRLPITFPAPAAPPAAPPSEIARDRLIRQVLTAAGFSESATFAFLEKDASAPFCEAGVEAAAIANPLSEKFAVLRPSLLPGLVDACAHNRRRERKDIRLFEAGSRFTPDGEGRAVAFVWCGAADGPHWSAPSRNVDFFDAQGVVEGICEAVGIEAEFVPTRQGFLVPGRAAEVRARPAELDGPDGTSLTLGVVGKLVPAIAEARGFPAAEDVFVTELDLRALTIASAGVDRLVDPLPRYPSIVRDISMLVDDTLPAATVRGTIRSSAPSTLVSIVEFDRYQGKGVPEGRVSLSLRLTFRAPDRTLTDDEVQAATGTIVEGLRTAHGAEQR
jgi:phenylalanyl-tRNA synthetase beta chain